ncbi:MAG: SH3 domain-containing protein [Pseudomonadota bacterium]
MAPRTLARPGSPHSERFLVVQQKSVRIEVPPPERGRFARVGVIAVVGFAVGVLWPHLTGVRVVPRAPSSGNEGSAESGTSTPAASATSSTPKKAERRRELFSIGPGLVTSCRTFEGEKLSECDAIDIDAIVRERIGALSDCDGFSTARGIFSVGFDVDFTKKRVVGVESGKSTTLAPEDTERLLSCLREDLPQTSLGDVRHRHARYMIYYRVELVGAESEESEGPAAITPASGQATVAWEVALVRAGPSRQDAVLARVLQGTRVSVTARQGDWYRVKYDAKGREGWVFRTAIGL